MSDVYAYHLFRAAQQKFGRKPKDLCAQESGAANAIARKTLFVEDQILGSQEARTVSVNPSDVRDARQAMIDSYGNYSDFLADLHGSGLDDALLSLSIERQLTVDKTIEKVISNIEEPSDAEITELYHRRKNEFVRPEQRAVSHILITVNPEFPENTPAEARKRITQLHVRLKQEPGSFARLAQLHSECPSALQSGDLGTVRSGQMMKPLENAAFTLRPGEISAPVETEAGFHIVRCDRIIAAQLVPLKEARAKIAEALGEANRQQAKRQWIKALCAPAASREPAAAMLVNSKREKFSPATQKRGQVCTP